MHVVAITVYSRCQVCSSLSFHLTAKTYWLHHKVTFNKQTNINKCVILCLFDNSLEISNLIYNMNCVEHFIWFFVNLHHCLSHFLLKMMRKKTLCPKWVMITWWFQVSPLKSLSFVHPSSRVVFIRSWLYVIECMLLPLLCSRCQVCSSSSFHLTVKDLLTSP